jgi:hypothetical protein
MVAAPVQTTPSLPTPSGRADAFIDFGNAPYPEANFLTTGNPQPWYTSPVVSQVFGGIPTPQQQSAFTNLVIQDLQQTFQASGLSVHLTTDPNVPAAHTFSIVAGATSPQDPPAIGMTDIGYNGFAFLDRYGQAQSVSELALALAHNAAHELMHAFGVSTPPDTSGQYLDAETVTWQLLTNPDAKLSPAAVQQILADDSNLSPASTGIMPMVLASPVPEPATWAAWTLVVALVAGYRYRQALRFRTAG